ncbi:MAG: 5'/3'-nucleotidase SurE [Thermodesulfobacteriota bacterium]
MKILLTNDDGIQAVGLRSLYHALVRAGHDVHVVAPVTEMSAVGHAVTLAAPLRVKIFEEKDFYGQGVSGTPADCVKLGLTTLLESPPDIVVSGINAGANVGVDILYSGTVSAATEGALMGYPALAVSFDHFSPEDLSAQGDRTAEFLARVDWAALPRHCVLNLNFPNLPVSEVKGLKVCPQTRAGYHDWYEEREDPRGRKYYWLTGYIPPERVSAGKDRALLTEGYMTLTPLRFDFTDHDTMQRLSGLGF